MGLGTDFLYSQGMEEEEEEEEEEEGVVRWAMEGGEMDGADDDSEDVRTLKT